MCKKCTVDIKTSLAYMFDLFNIFPETCFILSLMSSENGNHHKGEYFENIVDC